MLLQGVSKKHTLASSKTKTQKAFLWVPWYIKLLTFSLCTSSRGTCDPGGATTFAFQGDGCAGGRRGGEMVEVPFFFKI